LNATFEVDQTHSTSDCCVVIVPYTLARSETVLVNDLYSWSMSFIPPTDFDAAKLLSSRCRQRIEIGDSTAKHHIGMSVSRPSVRLPVVTLPEIPESPPIDDCDVPYITPAPPVKTGSKGCSVTAVTALKR